MRTHTRETSNSTLLALCEGNSPVSGDFPAQRVSNAKKAYILSLRQLTVPPVTTKLSNWQSFGFSDISLNKYWFGRDAMMFMPRLYNDRDKTNHNIQQTTSITHPSRDKIATISQTTFSKAFSWMKMYENSVRFHWYLFIRFEPTISQHWFR